MSALQNIERGRAVKEIQLSQGQVALVDDCKCEELNQWKWSAMWNPRAKSYYAFRQSCLPTIDGQPKIRRPLYMHRFLLGLEYGDPRIGDHREPSETLNNQLSNLRIANTDTESNANQTLRSDNTSGFKGVSQRSDGYGYTAYCRGRNLGTRLTPDAAFYELYVPAAKAAFGEFARLV